MSNKTQELKHKDVLIFVRLVLKVLTKLHFPSDVSMGDLL